MEFLYNKWTWLAVTIGGFALCAILPGGIRDERLLKRITQWFLVPVSIVLICYAYPVGLEMFRRLALQF